MSTRNLLLLCGSLILATVIATGVILYAPKLLGGKENRAELPEMAENERIVYLFFPADDGEGKELALEARIVPDDLDGTSLAEEIVRQLLAGPQGDLPPIFPGGSELRTVFLDAEGVVYLDLDRAAFGRPTDSVGEVLFLNAILESLRRNLEDIHGVKFLVDSTETDTLWGHVDGRMPWRGWQG